MHRAGPGFFVQMPREVSNDRGNLPTHSQLQIISGHEAVCAHGAPQRFQRSVSGFSGLLREEAFELGGTSEIQRRGVSDEIRPFRTGAHASHPRRRAQTRAARRQVRAARLSSSHRSLSHLNLVARRLLLVARSLARRRGCDARVLHPKGPISQLTSRA